MRKNCSFCPYRIIQCKAAAVMFYLQTGEQLGELGEERQENKADEVGLRRRFGHFVSIHERSHWKPFEFLCVTLLHTKRGKRKKHVIALESLDL